MKWLLPLILLSYQASARVGETAEQCHMRYGWPQDVNRERGTVSFVKDGFDVVLTFHEGVARSIFYSPRGQRHGKITKVQIETFLAANAGSSEFIETVSGFVSTTWATRDGKLLALYHHFQGALMIASPEEIQRVTDLLRNDERRKLGGF